MNYPKILFCVFLMALVTYLPRMLPFVLMKRKITNPFLCSLLEYIPYAILAAMTFPEIFFSVTSFVAGVVGCLVALVLAYYKKGLLIVALSASLSVFVVEQVLAYFHLPW